MEPVDATAIRPPKVRMVHARIIITSSIRQEGHLRRLLAKSDHTCGPGGPSIGMMRVDKCIRCPWTTTL